jgi:hypothetical protein
MITILAAALALSGPNFTETVYETDDKFSLNYVSHDSGNVDSPLGLWFSFSGNPSNLSGELSHKSVSYSLFENYTPTTSPVFIAPIDAFFGEKVSGNWQLKIQSDTPFELNQWGVTTTIPEPSTFSLLFLGSLLYLTRTKKP